MTDLIEAGVERRAYPLPVEVRAAPEGSASPGILAGYALKFNETSRDLGGWVEEIDPLAFGAPLPDGSLDLTRHNRVLARDNHDSNGLLGTTDAGTLRITIDETGLLYEVDLPDTTRGRDVAVLARRGDYAYSSFAFHLLPGGVSWRENADGTYVRTVTSATLVDVAPVADPAYWSSSTGVRSIDLDAVRASLKPEPPAPGDFERSVAEQAQILNARFGGGKG